ncbi:hypothetical protein [Cupriavidus lacunae]|uniref:Uncharacterized protein n=1 Tax=Cupriavidus lacunae TaxID=2666307 RepID=A0A370MVX8_9BURK|nr:hypothetical protein [Cupriavidus lacunae]RDJ97533.1 hypothetical protein DN412_42330 [Cupriavidus lacunae]
MIVKFDPVAAIQASNQQAPDACQDQFTGSTSLWHTSRNHAKVFGFEHFMQAIPLGSGDVASRACEP